MSVGAGVLFRPSEKTKKQKEIKKAFTIFLARIQNSNPNSNPNYRFLFANGEEFIRSVVRPPSTSQQTPV